MNRAGIAYQRVPGVDGRKMSAEELRKGYSPVRFFVSQGHRPTVAEVACAMSHRKCWIRLLEDGDELGAVFEDDMLVDPSAYELAYAQVQADDDSAKPKVWLLSARNRVKDPGGKAVVRLLDTANDVMGTWGGEGYFLNAAAAKKLVGIQSPVRYVADSWSAYARLGVEISVVFPTACRVDEVPSVIARCRTGIKAKMWYRHLEWKMQKVFFWLDMALHRVLKGVW